MKYMAPTASPITRGSGHKAVAAAAYRSGSKLHDEKHECIHDYSKRNGVAYSEIALPEGAPEWMHDREKLWNAVEAKEDTHTRRASAQLAKEYMCQLPRELSEEQQKAVLREWVGGLIKRGLVCDWSLHQAQAADGGANPHAHCMVATRSVDAADPHGFGKKWAGDPSIACAGRNKSPLDDDRTLLRFKEEYTAICNAALEKAGSDVRITHLSYEAQGVDAQGGIHKGKDATAREKKGEKTQVGSHNRKVKYDNVLRPYDRALQASQDGWAFPPPSAEKQNWNKKVAEWQMVRGSAMASRDAAQKGMSNVAAPPASRSESRTDMARQGAILAHRQSQTYRARVEKSRETERGPER